MTDDRLPIDASDEELASAYVDGEVTDAERARVEADPRLLALAESFRATAAAVGSPVMPLDRLRRDTLVQTALAAAEPDADPEVAPVDAPERRAAKVIPIGRSRWFTRAPGLAAAAAFLFLVGIGLVITSQGSDRDQSAEQSTASADSSGDGASEDASDTAKAQSEPPSAGAEEGTSTDDDARSTLTAPAADLGDFSDEGALRQSLAAEPSPSTPPASDPVPTTNSTPESPSAEDAEELDAARRFRSDAERCDTVVTTGDPLLGDLVAVRAASIAGEPVLVFTHVDLDDPDRVIDTVADRGSCQVRFALAR